MTAHHTEPEARTTAMRREIAEQPAAAAGTLDALLPLTGEIEALGRRTRRVMFLGRGTSDNAAMYGQYLCSVRAGRHASLGSPSLATVYDARLDLSDVLAVAVSQSGETAEILETMRWAQSCGAATVAVTNGAGSTLAEEADLALVTQAGPELAVPATKTYTAQLTALAVLGLSLSGPDPLLEELEQIPDAIAETLSVADAAAELAAELREESGLVVTSRGYLMGNALEMALKLKEACYLNAAGMSYADLLHGPIAATGPGGHVVVIAPSEGPLLGEFSALARRFRAQGLRVHGIGGDTDFARAVEHHIALPALPEALSPLVATIPGQLVTESLAHLRGIDPDSPRGLNKVTQTEA